MKFNILEQLVNHLENNPKEAMKAIISDKYCPKCKMNADMQAMEDGNIKCLKCESILTVK